MKTRNWEKDVKNWLTFKARSHGETVGAIKNLLHKLKINNHHIQDANTIENYKPFKQRTDIKIPDLGVAYKFNKSKTIIFEVEHIGKNLFDDKEHGVPQASNWLKFKDIPRDYLVYVTNYTDWVYLSLDEKTGEIKELLLTPEDALKRIHDEHFIFGRDPKLEVIEEFFNHETKDSKGRLEFKLVVVPKNQKHELFDKNDYWELIETLRNSINGYTGFHVFKEVFDKLEVTNGGIYSKIEYSGESNPNGGNVFISKKGYVIFKCYYNVKTKMMKKLPIESFFLDFTLKFFDLLRVLYNKFQYNDDLNIYFFTDKLTKWMLHTDSENLPYKGGDFPLKLNFEFRVEDLASRNDINYVINDKIIKEIQLAFGYLE